jgi:hypothetical protein
MRGGTVISELPPTRADKRQRPEPSTPPSPAVRRRPLEEHATDVSSYRSEEQQRELERREAPLVQAFASLLSSKGHDVDGVEVTLPDATRPFRVDLFDYSADMLVEAKWSPSVEDVRMALGQLAHYRFLLEQAPDGPRVQDEVVLLGSEPSEHIKEFLKTLFVGLVWQDGESFVDYPSGSILPNEEER